MVNVDIADAASQLVGLIERAVHRGERIVITRQGKPLAALVNVAELSMLEAAEQRSPVTPSTLPPPLSEEDYAEFAASMQEVMRERQRPDWTRPPVDFDG